MKQHSITKLLGKFQPVFWLLPIILIFACNLPGYATTPETQAERDASTHTPQTAVGKTGLPQSTSATNTGTPTSIPESTLTQTATIAHVMRPGTPGVTEWYVTDYTSQSTASQKRAPGGDSFPYNLFERPFLAADMKYLPGIDIIRADIAKDDNWFYVTIRLQAAPTAEEKQSARYGVEVDADIDGRGEYLFWVSAPGGTEWTTDGVQIWEDPNGDVGGPVPVRSDAPGERDGYEKLTFDQGRGTDPDAAWARFSPANATDAQIAFKRDAIGMDLEFLWAAWADAGNKQPGWFDYNDHFTSAEAGSPLSAQANYPLAALFAVDNTCRMAYGFTLLGTEPGACYIPTPTITPTLTATPTIGFSQPTQHLEPVAPFKVTAVVLRVNKTEYTGPCSALGLQFWGEITVNRSGDVVYVWEKSVNDGPFERIIGIQTMSFAAAGTKNTNTYSLSTPSGDLRLRIQIMEPNIMYSNVALVRITCT